MASTASLRGNATAEDTSLGGFSINNRGFVIDTDVNSFTDCSSNGSPSYWNVVTDFSMTLTPGATVDGIEVVIRADRSGAAGSIPNIKIVQAGNIVGTGTSIANGALNAGTPTDYTIGGPTDLWGQSWTAVQINANTFGVAYNQSKTASGTSRVYDIHIKVYYTPVASFQAAWARCANGLILPHGAA